MRAHGHAGSETPLQLHRDVERMLEIVIPHFPLAVLVFTELITMALNMRVAPGQAAKCQNRLHGTSRF